MPTSETVQKLTGRKQTRHSFDSLFVTCVFALIALSPLKAPAAVYFDLSLSPIYEKANASIRPSGGSWESEKAVGTSTRLGYDLRGTLGLTLFDTIFVGGTVNSLSADLSRGAAGDDTNKSVTDSRFEYGPSIGLVWGGFHLIGTHFLEATRKQSVNETQANGSLANKTESTDIGGSGFQVSMGYTFRVTSGWRIGPSLIYREMTYEKQTLTDSVTPGNSYRERGYFSRPVEAGFTPFLTSRVQF